MSENDSMKKVEAALFVAARFLSIDEIVMLTGVNPISVKEILVKLKSRYDANDAAITILNRNELWKMDIRQEYSGIMTKLASGKAEFTKAEQETLAVIAYKQPIKQSVIIKIRGNKAYDHIKRFIEMGLLKYKRIGHTLDIQLSEEFYDYFQIGKKEENEEIGKQIEQAEKEIESGSEHAIIPEKKKKQKIKMAPDVIMEIGTCIFFILFAFLIFTTVTVILSLFIKRKYRDYEPGVSVVIPCYNGEKSIEKCLDNVFALSYPEKKIEVIVVDDGSTDNTMNILKSLKKQHSNLKIIKGNHEGKSASLNIGAKKASHDIIFTIDADTFVERDSLKRLVNPFSDNQVGATNGSCVAYNSDSMIAVFQRIEYHYNNLLRKSFSLLFNNGIWFFGAFACYRKDVLKKIGYFKTDTMTEDMDTAMEIYLNGYRTINVYDALGYTIVPSTIKHFYNQRIRWWVGALQTLRKNRILFSKKSNPSILFLFISQYWWTLYALISLPLLAYQVYYWLPYNTQNFYALFMYLFRWFSLAGPFYVLYKIPEWGISAYNIFGVLSGVISVFLIIWAIYLFKDRLGIKNFIGLFFYFPYTIILNSIIALSIIRIMFLKRGYFIA